MGAAKRTEFMNAKMEETISDFELKFLEKFTEETLEQKIELTTKNVVNEDADYLLDLIEILHQRRWISYGDEEKCIRRQLTLIGREELQLEEEFKYRFGQRVAAIISETEEEVACEEEGSDLISRSQGGKVKDDSYALEEKRR